MHRPIFEPKDTEKSRRTSVGRGEYRVCQVAVKAQIAHRVLMPQFAVVKTEPPALVKALHDKIN